jgi:glycosyltransferase involved in cell wall biosynthesis
LTAAPRVAIACSGLGHIQRGIESWAADLASGLERAGAEVTLFAGAPLSGKATVLPTYRRTSRAAVALAGGMRRLGGWRYGMGSPYDVEQSRFALALWRRIRNGFDILHVQDPMIAIWLERARRMGLSGPKVIYANGTGENAAVMRRFAFLQLLTPAAADEWDRNRPDNQTVFVIPNFIDTERFRPGDPATSRAKFGLPPGRTIILCCAAIRRFHKRVDVLARAFAEVCRESDTDAMLVVAGGREADTDALIAEGTALLGDRIRFLPDLPRDSMPDLYRAADGFVLASLQEMFGIVLLEALASGLPVVCNATPDFRAIVGPGGVCLDLGSQNGLARGLTALLDHSTRSKLAQAGRPHVQQSYSESAVIREIVAMYNSVQATSSYVR